MIEVRPGGRRLIDRVLDPAFLDGIESVPLDEVRARRDDAAQEETDLSYLRRLLHGRMDLVRAELAHRHGAPGTLGDELPAVLAAGVLSPAHGSGRFQSVSPSRADEHRRSSEALIADPTLSDVPALSNDQLDDALRRYQAEEASVSEHRHQVQQVMDAANAEIGRRYRDGDATVEGLLRSQHRG